MCGASALSESVEGALIHTTVKQAAGSLPPPHQLRVHLCLDITTRWLKNPSRRRGTLEVLSVPSEGADEAFTEAAVTGKPFTAIDNG